MVSRATKVHSQPGADGAPMSDSLTQWSSFIPTVSFLRSQPDDGEELKIDTHNCWAMIPTLFDSWDFHNTESINREELMSGLERYSEENGVRLRNQRIEKIFRRVDLKNQQELDRREFSAFLRQFAESHKQNLCDVVNSLLDIVRDMRGEKVLPGAGSCSMSHQSKLIHLWNGTKGLWKKLELEVYDEEAEEKKKQDRRKAHKRRRRRKGHY